MDFKLDDNHDLDLSSNDIELVDGSDAIAQHVLTRLRFFLGEWFLDTRIGIPYYSDILIKNPNLVAVRSYLSEAVLTTPGIEALKEFTMDFDGNTRSLRVAFTATVEDSEIPLVFDEEMILL